MIVPHKEHQTSVNVFLFLYFWTGAASHGGTAKGDAEVSNAIKTYLLNLKVINLHPTPIDQKRAKRLISNVERSSDEEDKTKVNFYEAILTFHETILVEFWYFGDLDEDGLFHGQATLKLTNDQSCSKGQCKTNPIGQIFGTFEHGLLQGPVLIYSPNYDSSTFFITKDGIVHSLAISIGLKPIYPYVEDLKYARIDKIMSLGENGIGYLSLFRNGKTEGPVWYGTVGEGIIGQGFLYGLPNKKGWLTGDNIAFIYPDHLTALVGKFEDKIMKAAKEAQVSQVSCQDGLINVEFSQPDKNSTVFFYDPPNNVSMASAALMTVRDPYEKRTVEVQESSVPSSGHGLFAIRDIPQGQVC